MDAFSEALIESAIADVMEKAEPTLLQVADALELKEGIERAAVRELVRMASIDAINRSITMMQELKEHARRTR